MYFLAQFCHFKIFVLVRGDCRGGFFFFFADSNSQSVQLFLSFLTPSILAFSKIWELVKSGCFTITHLSWCSFWENNFFKPFSLLWVLNLVIFLTVFLLFDDLCKGPLISLKWTFPHLITLFSVFVWCFPLPIFQHILWIKRKNIFY